MDKRTILLGVIILFPLVGHTLSESSSSPETIRREIQEQEEAVASDLTPQPTSSKTKLSPLTLEALDEQENRKLKNKLWPFFQHIPDEVFKKSCRFLLTLQKEARENNEIISNAVKNNKFSEEDALETPVSVEQLQEGDLWGILTKLAQDVYYDGKNTCPTHAEVLTCFNVFPEFANKRRNRYVD